LTCIDVNGKKLASFGTFCRLFARICRSGNNSSKIKFRFFGERPAWLRATSVL
jgi:hypothetical protein